MENFIFWYIQPLLGNDHVRNKEKTAVARQRPTSINGRNVGSAVFNVVSSEVISLV
jgi:hypothetical protein